jgi:hypothetical protein
MYKILGSDGNEYGPLSAEKIKQWILEGRLEKKTPVLPDGAEDWVFLSSLPEFEVEFASPQKMETAVPVKNRRWRTVLCIGLLLLAVTGVVVIFILKNARHH